MGWRSRGLAALLIFVMNCSPPEQDCPAVPDVAVTEPTVGETRGTITWLQTGEVSEFVIQTSAPDVATGAPAVRAVHCQERATAEVTYELSGTDAVVVRDGTQTEEVDAFGRFSSSQLVLVLDAQRLLAEGVAPEQPGLAEREPYATLTLQRRDGFTEGTVTVNTRQDQLTLGMVTFELP